MTIEIGEREEGGIQAVRVYGREPSYVVGHIVKTESGNWLAIPSHYRNLPWTLHKLRRHAVSNLTYQA